MGDSGGALAAFDAARSYLLSEMSTNPDDHRLHSAMGIALAGLGRHAEAIQEGERGVELLPVNVDVVIRST